ncbi:MAG: leucine-rich repeat protein [Lachnospiraceae bacterium]|nr:leucine-rich repeat protein [Lachnospiraceae bacterium]
MRNKFTQLDVTLCPKMKRLDIWDNPGLGSIDVSKCPGLQYYNCANNSATNVDVSNNKELQKLICSYNRDCLKTLDVTHNPKLLYLDCSCNDISKLDLSKNTYLYYLMAFTNPLTKIDISYNPFLVQTYNKGVKADESNTCKGHSWTLDYGGDTSTGDDNKCFLCFDDSAKLVINKKVANNLLDATDRPHDEDNLPAKKERVTREMVVVTLYEMAGKPSVKGLKSRFKDVVKGAWYEDALLWGEKNSICVGYPYVTSDYFGVGKCVQRQDMALMLMRYAELMGYDRAIDFGRTDDYIDYYEIDYYAWEALTWAVTWGIMEGKGPAGSSKAEQKIGPHDKVTRKELESTIRIMLDKNNIKLKNIPVPSYQEAKVITDGDGVKYYVATNIKAKDLKKNLAIADKKSGGKYRITKITKKHGKIKGGTVTYVKPYNKYCSTAKIKDSIKLCGITFKVTSISKKAFKNNNVLTKVTIGKNVKSIGASAFENCSNLKTINSKSTVLKKVGKNALKGTPKKIIIKGSKRCIKPLKAGKKNSISSHHSPVL